MTGKDQKIAADVPDIDLLMHNHLAGIDQNQRAFGMRRSGNFPYGQHRAENIGHSGYGNQFGFIRQVI